MEEKSYLKANVFYKEQYEIQTKLAESLNKEQTELLVKLMDVNLTIAHIEAKASFRLGCKVGINLKEDLFT